jgi:hypothetical protein
MTERPSEASTAGTASAAGGADPAPRQPPASSRQRAGDPMPASESYWLMRIGSVAAVLGALLAGVGNLLHPATPRDDEVGVARVINHSEHWTLIHVVIVVGVVLMLGGLLGIRHSIAGRGSTDALTRLGMYAATIGTTVGVILVILDGVAAKQLADQWAQAPAATKPIALGLVSANETVNFALAGLFNLSFAGIPFVLFGLAVARTDTYPQWLGWVAAGAGAGSIGAGIFQAFTGKPTVASLVLTIIGPTVIVLWLLIMGILLRRRSREALLSQAGCSSW